MNRTFSVEDILAVLPEWTAMLIENEKELAGIGQVRVSRPHELRGSGPTDLAYFFSKHYQADLLQANPGILVVGQPFVEPLRASGLPVWKQSVILSSKDPYAAMAILSQFFASSAAKTEPVLSKDPLSLIHPSAVIDPSVKLGENVRIGAHCTLDSNVVIGSDCELGPGCWVGAETQIGSGSTLFAGVCIYEKTQIGDRVRIHAGAVVGADGFGYASSQVGLHKIHHFGIVVLEEGVEIGANSCIDRGTLGETRIGKNSKLDNLVHIGHNCTLEHNVIVCGGTCLAGHASVGTGAYIGGLSGVGNRVHIGSGARVGALTMVTKDVPKNATAVGNPQRSYHDHFRSHAALSRLSKRRTK